MTRAQRDSGFTLIEALMAVLVLAIIAALMVPAVQGSLRLEQRVSGRLVEREGHARLVQLLDEAIGNIQPTPTGFETPALVGGPSRLSVMTRIPATGRMARFELAVSQGQAEIALQPVMARASEEAVSVQLDGIGQSPRFHYFGETEARDGVAWRDDWPYTHLPRLVVLDFEPVAGHTRRVEILVPSTGGFTCAFDSGLGACLGGGP